MLLRRLPLRRSRALPPPGLDSLPICSRRCWKALKVREPELPPAPQKSLTLPRQVPQQPFHL